MTDKLALQLIKRFGHQGSVLAHWFVNRIERRAPLVSEDIAELVELKADLKALDEALKEMDREI